MPRSPKKRIDALLVEQGYFDDLKTAQGFILAGKIVVDEKVCSTPGSMFREDAKIFVRGVVLKFASRGGYKLEAALDRFAIEVTGKVVLDAGASTGGFTDCALQRGAAKVYAVDVGFGQLRGKLATDPRVVNMEKTNVGDLTRDVFDPPIELAVFDLSYLSITKSAPMIAALFVKPVQMIGLIKPLYEGVDQERGADPQELREALLRVIPALATQGLLVRELIPSPIRGTNGTVEFLAKIVAAGDDTANLTLADRAIDELKFDP